MPLATEQSALERLVEATTNQPEMCPRPSFARTSTEALMRRCAFPLTFVAAHVVIARSLWRMARAGDRNVGKLTLFLLAAVELIMFWVFLPTALGAFETFYGAETFRRFFYAVTPATGSLLNILSGADTFLTLLVCYEFRLVAENAKARALFSGLKRQLGLYGAIVLLSVAVSAFTFAVSYTTVFRCNGSRMDVRPLLLIAPQWLSYGQYLFAAVVIVAPSVLLARTNFKLARHVGYTTLPTEANELIAGSKCDLSLSKLRCLLAALTVTFVVPHVLSLAPIFISYPTVSYPTMLGLMSITNWLLFASRVLSYALLHKISHHLAKMGVVHVY